ncbi:DUF2306-like membrane protein [Pontimonas salivibrio]|uniref:DUF2306-like membrane protein n=1 Tax=Pontimonas salivibrio TaxID=1159327 RepID=A0A2L2BPU1_9MICO|nr:DUF2306-like membrane protein [Pontimonas salivibrio]
MGVQYPFLVEFIIEMLLIIHVLSGVVALVAAFVAVGVAKGATFHRRVGTVFFWAMLGVGITAIPVTFVRPNPFLFFIALFSFYMAFAGYRRGRRLHVDEGIDVIAAWLMLVFGVVMIGYGVFMVVSDEPLGWALASFGGLGLSFGLEDVVKARRTPAHAERVSVHLSRMLGGTIATITAVLVQQVSPLVDDPLEQVALWLGPTVVLVPVIVLWTWRIAKTGKYRLFSPTPGSKVSA